MSEKEKMLYGVPYNPNDKELIENRINTRKILKTLDNLDPEDLNKRREVLKNLLGSTGQNITIEDGFKCDYGFNIHVGENFFANFNFTVLDSGEVKIGKNCFIGPNVQIYTACHAVTPDERNSGVEFAIPVTIGDNCWIGGGVIINPGITLGNNVVVGSGTVVTKNFGDNVVIAGNPVRVIKIIE